MSASRDLAGDLDWLIGHIRDGYEPEKIILFVSLARGDAHEWSDIDLIVVKDTDASYGERVRNLLPVLRGWRGGADILVYSLEEYERDGVVLYERHG